MEGQASAADIDRFLILPHPAAFFGELRERDRRRVFLDPAPEILNSWTVRHSFYGTVTLTGADELVRPRLSTTVNLTGYELAAANECDCTGFEPVVVVPSPHVNV